MKFLFTLGLLFISSTAVSQQNQEIVGCTYKVKKADGMIFSMSGNILPQDIPEDSDATYLTLQPPSVAHIKYDVRILVTIWNYNPVTIHPRGDTVSVVASTELKNGNAQLDFVDDEGNEYKVACQQRQ